jgi:hypothetical protein
MTTQDHKKKPTLAELYDEAFKSFSTEALWSMRPVEHPTPDDALAIVQALRTHGKMPGRQLAEQIEEAASVAKSKAKNLHAIIDRAAARPVLDERTADEIIGYDDIGAPE